MSSQLSQQQILQGAYDGTNKALQVENIAGAIVPEPFDSLALTYILSGPGTGQIGTVKYYIGGLSGALVATLTLAYDISNNLISVVRT